MARFVEWSVCDCQEDGTALPVDQGAPGRNTAAGGPAGHDDDRPRYRVPLPQALPAGWYRLRGRMVPETGSLVLPSLHPRYVGQKTLKFDVGLPDPDPSGGLDALVSLSYDADALAFCPGVCPPPLRTGSFRLRRVSRWRALWIMTANTQAEPAKAGERWRRLLRFLRGAITRGVRAATEVTFADYRRRLRPGGISDYELWVRKFDTLSPADLSRMSERSARLASRGPLISVLLPTWNTDEPCLRRCLDSVLAQVWPKWELCIADDASSDPRVMDVLGDYAARDPRIRVTRREHNGHISAASNTALAMANGAFVALLDHDDELRPHALLEMAEAIVAHADVGLLYSDEDKLDADGCRYDPNFKPDWNPDLLLGQNYVCHLAVLRTDLVREAGGFRKGYEGSQDHDLFLRCSERLTPAQVVHVPRVLYHWRAIEGSTALTREAKDYASEAGLHAVQDHLDRLGSGAQAQALGQGYLRVRWPLPVPAPKVSLVIPTRDRLELLRPCVESLLERTDYPDFELVVVDNRSTDAATLDYLQTLTTRQRIRVLRYDQPFNYAAMNNWAAGQCDGEVIGLVNNDIEAMDADWLREMVSHALRPGIGAVGAMLYYPDDTIQHAGVILGVHGVAAHVYAGMPRGYHGFSARAWVAQNLSAVTAACMVVRRSVFEQVGGLDERLQVAFNDIDFCLRVREAGYRNVWTPFAELYHHESATRGSDETGERKARFAREVRFMQDRWGDALLNDPAYNPNLTLHAKNFEPAFPPRTAPI